MLRREIWNKPKQEVWMQIKTEIPLNEIVPILDFIRIDDFAFSIKEWIKNEQRKNNN